jgi:hypothetical protein
MKGKWNVSGNPWNGVFPCPALDLQFTTCSFGGPSEHTLSTSASHMQIPIASETPFQSQAATKTEQAVTNTTVFLDTSKCAAHASQCVTLSRLARSKGEAYVEAHSCTHPHIFHGICCLDMALSLMHPSGQLQGRARLLACPR